MSGQRGFTLIELVVAVSIFALLVGTVAGVFTGVVRSQRSSIAQAELLGEAQTFLELLEREVRTGFGSSFGQGTESEFYFKNQEGWCVKYFRDSPAGALPQIRRAESRVAGCSPSSLSGGVNVSAPDVSIDALEFVVTTAGVDPSSGLLTGEQGRVTVRVRACPRGVTDERCLSTQTTLTSRQYGPL